MHKIFSTAVVPQAEAYDLWIDVARVYICDHESSVPDRSRFCAAIEVGKLDDLSFAAWQADVSHSRARGTDTDDLCPSLLSCVAIEIAGRSFVINRNICLLDPREPHVAHSLEPNDRMIVRIPRKALGERMSLTTEVVNRPYPLQGDAALLAAFVRGIVRTGPSTLSPEVASLVRNALLDLIAVALRPQSEPTGLDYVRSIMEAGILDAERIADRPARARAALAQAGRRIRE